MVAVAWFAGRSRTHGGARRRGVLVLGRGPMQLGHMSRTTCAPPHSF